ncbi:hypothetical protein [Tenacibaculum aestuariivivum]|uniref:hypothetical protein n=1 Tax=Tenacibaculum aestuariivivum TaxID=2006131 RepID=UPI003AB20C0B
MIKRLILVMLLLSTITITAQKNSASPYSYFGIGEQYKAVTVEQASMGGIGVALKDTYHLNFLNPAANADLGASTYTIGGSLTFYKFKEAKVSQSDKITNLRYISLGFPLGKNAGFSVGLRPFSSVGYSLLNDYNADEVSVYKGEGGTSKIYASYGMYLLKGFSIGLEAGYIFGNLENSIINQRIGNSRVIKSEEDVSVRGGLFKIGAQYKTEFNNKLQFYSGASFVLRSDLSTKGTERIFTFSASNGELDVKQELSNNINGDVTIPVKSVFGFGLGKQNKWYIGINQQFQSALSSSSSLISNISSYKYDDSSRLSVGGYYIPKMNSISSYWDRVTYRAGLRFEDTGLLIATNNDFTEIKDFGINVGLGLPLPRELSNINIGFEYGQKGTTSNNLIKEEYFNVRLSLSLNSLKWFNKRKID